LFTGVLQWESLLWQFGGDLYNSDVTKATFNSDAGVEALTWMVNLVKDGYSPKDVAQDAEYVAFQNGKNALHWNGIWQINAFKEIDDLDWGVAPVPQIGDEKGVWSGSHNFVIMNQQPLDDNKVQASKVFINWISQQSIEWAKAGQIPARNSVRESQEFLSLEEQSTLAQQVDYVHFVPPEPGIADVQVGSFDQAINEAVLLRKEPKAALDDAAQKADQLLEENRQKYQA
jgi:multiple sugar transport system substrate-binding protein